MAFARGGVGTPVGNLARLCGVPAARVTKEKAQRDMPPFSSLFLPPSPSPSRSCFNEWLLQVGYYLGEEYIVKGILMPVNRKTKENEA